MKPKAAVKAPRIGLTERVQAGIAEFLLVTRLRARRPVVEPTHSAEVVAQGAKIVQLTCKHWFGPTTPDSTTRSVYRTRL